MFKLPQLTQTKAWIHLFVALVRRDLLYLDIVNVMSGMSMVCFTHEDLCLGATQDLEILLIPLCQHHRSHIRHHHQTQTILGHQLLHHLRRPRHRYHLHYHLHRWRLGLPVVHLHPCLCHRHHLDKPHHNSQPTEEHVMDINVEAVSLYFQHWRGTITMVSADLDVIGIKLDEISYP